MLKRLLKSLKREEINPIATQVPVTASAVTIRRDEHTISRKKISKNALNVMYELTRAGYQAYLVGGGVRDLLLGLSPKDFDVATDATPEQVKQLAFSAWRCLSTSFLNIKKVCKQDFQAFSFC